MAEKGFDAILYVVDNDNNMSGYDCVCSLLWVKNMFYRLRLVITSVTICLGLFRCSFRELPSSPAMFPRRLPVEEREEDGPGSDSCTQRIS